MDLSPFPTIRPAAPADIPALVHLAATTFVETFGHLYPAEDLAAFLAASRCESAYARLLAEPGTFVGLACEDSAAPVGYVVAGSCKLPVEQLEPRAGEVRELYVLASHQKHRLGSRLLIAALEWLETQRRAPLYVGVWSDNLGAQRLYARFGFEKVGEYEFPVGKTRDREFILKRN